MIFKQIFIKNPSGEIIWLILNFIEFFIPLQNVEV